MSGAASEDIDVIQKKWCSLERFAAAGIDQERGIDVMPLTEAGGVGRKWVETQADHAGG